MSLNNRMEASSFCALLSGMKRFVFFLPALSHLILKAPHATSENTTYRKWNSGRMSVVYVGYTVCSVALRNKRKYRLWQVLWRQEMWECEVKSTEYHSYIIWVRFLGASPSSVITMCISPSWTVQARANILAQSQRTGLTVLSYLWNINPPIITLESCSNKTTTR